MRPSNQALEVSTADLKKIIADGIKAPSGENCQPWRFGVSGGTIRVYNVPEADDSIYDFNKHGSYVAIGALIENMVLSARHYGYAPRVELFPDSNDANLVAALLLSPAPPSDDPLYEYIAKRATNRKPYRVEKIGEAAKKELAAAAGDAGAELRIVDDATLMPALGRALAVNEEVMFENKELHDFFYSHLLWQKDEQLTRSGFYVETLEFLPKQLPAIKLLRSWTMLKIFNRILKMSKQIAKENAEKYAGSGALIAVLVEGDSHADYVRAGRAAERAWLTATKLGIAAHPCTGPLYYMENIVGGNAGVFSPAHQKLIKDAYQTITEAFDAGKKTIPMLMRIGYADAPTATAMRMEPKIENKS